MCLLNALQPNALQTVAGQIVLHKYVRGQRITTEGDVPATVRMVKVGTVFGYRRGIEGGERPIGIAGRGAMFGLFAYLQQPNQFSTVAASTTYICEIPVSTLRQLVRDFPSFGQDIAAGIARTWGFLSDWSGGMRLQGLTNQLAYALAMLGRTQCRTVVELPTQAALGQLLNAGRETISRALYTLHEEGCIELLSNRRCDLRRHKLLARVRAGEPPNSAAPVDLVSGTR